MFKLICRKMIGENYEIELNGFNSYTFSPEQKIELSRKLIDAGLNILNMPETEQMLDYLCKENNLIKKLK